MWCQKLLYGKYKQIIREICLCHRLTTDWLSSCSNTQDCCHSWPAGQCIWTATSTRRCTETVDDRSDCHRDCSTRRGMRASAPSSCDDSPSSSERNASLCLLPATTKQSPLPLHKYFLNWFMFMLITGKLEGCYSMILHCKLSTPNESTLVPQKWVKGDLHIFHQNVAQLSLFWKIIFLPSVLWRRWLGRKGIWPVKNWVVGCWHGYLSRARCRLAYGSADATATHCLLLQ